VRFSPEQITATLKAIRQRKRQLGRSIATAEANRRAGQKIQHNTHDANVAELATLDHVCDALEVARRQIQYRIEERLQLATPSTKTP
jgi:hypothetical protein